MRESDIFETLYSITITVMPLKMKYDYDTIIILYCCYFKFI